jgi:nucleotide-binding universal stress UspA family protein/nitroimidazol reductase NimA-like FMN-containing flavoprotein (pyridoxamine 5'-phosphate oxidase superfamily)
MVSDDETMRQVGSSLTGAGPVVAGVDGSDEAQRGIDFAAQLAVDLDRQLVVVHALGLFDRISGWQTPVAEYEREADELVRTEWCATLDDVRGLQWSARVERGEAVHTLLAVADDVGASLVVVGSHGAGASIDPFLGSTSQKLLLKSRRPVVVVPPGSDHAHERPRPHPGDAGAGRADSESDEVVDLDLSQCWSRLRTTDVGRLAVPIDPNGADIFPVSYVVDRGTLVFRTAVGTKLDALDAAGQVAIEADGKDADGVVWSVVVKGAAHAVERTDEVVSTFDLEVHPLHSSPKPFFVRLEPTGVTGREFRVGSPTRPDGA